MFSGLPEPKISRNLLTWAPCIVLLFCLSEINVTDLFICFWPGSLHNSSPLARSCLSKTESPIGPLRLETHCVMYVLYLYVLLLYRGWTSTELFRELQELQNYELYLWELFIFVFL